MNLLHGVMILALLSLVSCATPPEQAIRYGNYPEAPADEFPSRTAELTETEPVKILPTKPQVMAFILSSPAFNEGQEIPVRFTCDGDDVSPQLEWVGVPVGTETLTLIMDDPDAPAGTWVHWVLYNLPPDLTGLEQGVQGVGFEGITSFNRTGYGGPCPPPGSSHRYFFKLYALDISLDMPAQTGKKEIEDTMQGHILAESVLMGTYAR
jgi:Raf kinase inhibitor-like YbhB/YbcL family protein